MDDPFGPPAQLDRVNSGLLWRGAHVPSLRWSKLKRAVSLRGQLNRLSLSGNWTRERHTVLEKAHRGEVVVELETGHQGDVAYENQGDLSAYDHEAIVARKHLRRAPAIDAEVRTLWGVLQPYKSWPVRP